MLGLLYAVLFVLTGCAGYSFSQRTSSTIKGWQMKNGNILVPLSTPDTIQLATIFFSIALKYVPFTRGYNARLKANESKDGFDLPILNLSGPVIITKLDIETFNTAVSRRFNKSNKQEDSLNPLFFVSLCTPVILHTLASHSCPIKPLGAVNTGNEFTYKDASFCKDAKAILKASQERQLTYSSKFGGSEMPAYRRRRGLETDIIIEIKNGDIVVLAIKFSFLQFLPRKHLPLYNEDQPEAKADSTDANKSAPTITPLFMSARHPSKWAASCSDYNPIHVSPLAAKFFGFSSTIAHGNHVIALALQDVLEDNGNPAAHILKRDRLSLQVRFVKPILLPADLKVHWRSSNTSEASLEVQNREGKACIIGELKS